MSNLAQSMCSNDDDGGSSKDLETTLMLTKAQDSVR